MVMRVLPLARKVLLFHDGSLVPCTVTTFLDFGFDFPRFTRKFVKMTLKSLYFDLVGRRCHWFVIPSLGC